MSFISEIVAFSAGKRLQRPASFVPRVRCRCTFSVPFIACLFWFLLLCIFSSNYINSPHADFPTLQESQAGQVVLLQVLEPIRRSGGLPSPTAGRGGRSAQDTKGVSASKATDFATWYTQAAMKTSRVPKSAEWTKSAARTPGSAREWSAARNCSQCSSGGSAGPDRPRSGFGVEPATVVVVGWVGDHAW